MKNRAPPTNIPIRARPMHGIEKMKHMAFPTTKLDQSWPSDQLSFLAANGINGFSWNLFVLCFFVHFRLPDALGADTEADSESD